MAEETKAPEKAESQFNAITSQAQLDKVLGHRISEIRKEYEGFEDYKKDAELYRKQEEENQTELEKTLKKLEETETKLHGIESAEQLKNMRAKVRKEKGLSEDFDTLLTGKTEEEITAQADVLSEKFKDTTKPIVNQDTGEHLDIPEDKNEWTDVLQNINSRK